MSDERATKLDVSLTTRRNKTSDIEEEQKEGKEDSFSENDGAFPESDPERRLLLDTLEKAPGSSSQIKLIHGYPTN